MSMYSRFIQSINCTDGAILSISYIQFGKIGCTGFYNVGCIVISVNIIISFNNYAQLLQMTVNFNKNPSLLNNHLTVLLSCR